MRRHPFILEHRPSRDGRRRRGAATIDYVMVTGITVPVTAVLLYLFWDALVTFYHFASTAITWPF